MLKKVKRRYLALKINSDETFVSKELMDVIWDAFLKLYGEYGASRSGMKLIHYDDKQKLAVLRVAHSEVEAVIAVLASITKIQSKPAAIHVLKVSGTIKALSMRK
ncbi:MAG: Rpp14/Pop5 family protein [Candidatus Bathyarchaeia archaeon]